MNVKSILKSMKAWEIVTSEEKEPTETHPAHSTRARSGEVDNANLQRVIETFKERRNAAKTLLRFSVNGMIQKQLRRMEDPAEMWITLGNQFNRTYSETERSIHASNLYTVKPRPGERISTYCERQLQYRDPVDGTNEAISDSVLLQHLFNNAGPTFTHTTHELRKRKNTISVQDAIDELSEFEKLAIPETIQPEPFCTPMVEERLRFANTARRRVTISPTVARKKRKNPRRSPPAIPPMLGRILDKQLARNAPGTTSSAGIAVKLATWRRTALSRKDRMSSKPPGIRSVLAKKEVPWWQMVIIPNNPSFSGRI